MIVPPARWRWPLFIPLQCLWENGVFVCGTEGSAFLPLLVVCSVIRGGSGDSMIHLTSTLEVVRGGKSCRRRGMWAVGRISFIAFISLPWPSTLVSVLDQYFLFGMAIHLQNVLCVWCGYHRNSMVLNHFCDGWNTFPINYIICYTNVFKKKKKNPNICPNQKMVLPRCKSCKAHCISMEHILVIIQKLKLKF